MIRSLRYTTQKAEWEVPAGSIEKGETPLQAGFREFFEETGIKLDSLESFIVYNPANGMSNQQVHITYGRAHGHGSSAFNKDETESVHWFSVDDLREMVSRNEITCGVTLMPLLCYLSGVLGI